MRVIYAEDMMRMDPNSSIEQLDEIAPCGQPPRRADPEGQSWSFLPVIVALPPVLLFDADLLRRGCPRRADIHERYHSSSLTEPAISIGPRPPGRGLVKATMVSGSPAARVQLQPPQCRPPPA